MKKVITEYIVRESYQNKQFNIYINKDDIITPLAKELANSLGINITLKPKFNRKKVVFANHKMNLSLQELIELLTKLNDYLKNNKSCDFAVFLPNIYIPIVYGYFKERFFKFGAQNFYFEENGAFTGEISLEMLEQFKIDWCLIGHSERRNIFNETDELINKKVLKSLDKKINLVLCIGETLEQRKKGLTFKTLEKQLKSAFYNVKEQDFEKIVIAYEPVWAIGTGISAKTEDIQKAHIFVRKTVADIYNEDVAEKVLILYGGSANDKNIDDILSCPDVDGTLVGSASLKYEKITKMIEKTTKF